MSWIERRKDILEQLRIKIPEAYKKKMSKETLIFWICEKFGCSKRTALEYLKQVEWQRQSKQD